MKFKPPFLLCIAVLVGSLSIFAQRNGSAAEDVKFRISFAGEKKLYRIGEPIKLVLSYTSSEPGYVVESYHSPLFDDVILSPADGIYPWLYRLNRHYSYDDVSAPQKLSQSPVEINITINNLVRFDKPGKYKLKVVSRRVWESSARLSFRSNAAALLSNEIEFEMKEMSEAEEAAEIKRITALMDSAPGLIQHQVFKRELDYLTGDASTRVKVERFLNPPVFNGVTWLDSGIGLDIARNKKLAVELLEAALRDPDRPINRGLVDKLVTLRLLMEDEQLPSRAETSQQLTEERASRSSALTSAYYEELVESLPRRAGKSQIFAAYTVFTALPRNDASSNAYHTTRKYLLEKFDQISPQGRSELLDYNWDRIKTPSLIPSLEKMILEKEPVPAWNVRANALKRLIELDQKRARPHVINEIRDPNSVMNPDILKALDDKQLPETDGALLEQITRLAATRDPRLRLLLQFKLTLAARYATDEIYEELLSIYKKYGVGWSMELSGPLLSYLVRHKDNEAIVLIEEKLAQSRERSGSNIFFHLTRLDYPCLMLLALSCAKKCSLMFGSEKSSPLWKSGKKR